MFYDCCTSEDNLPDTWWFSVAIHQQVGWIDERCVHTYGIAEIFTFTFLHARIFTFIFLQKFVYLCWPYLGVVVCLVMIHLACCYVWFWSLMQKHSFISTLGFGWLAAACVQQQRIWLVWVKTECFGLLRKGPGRVLLHCWDDPCRWRVRRLTPS